MDVLFPPSRFYLLRCVFLCDQPEHEKDIAAVGGQKTAPLARQGLSTYAYKDHTDYIKSEWGGYGLYYRSVMMELGLLYPGGPGFPYPMDLPTEYGKQIAAAYRQAVQDTEYYQHYFDHAFQHGGEKNLAKARRETFQLFLDIAEQTAETGVDQDTFRQLLYFQASYLDF